MSDTPQQTATNPAQSGSDPRIMAIVCYVLFLLAFTNGVTGIVGVVLAYIKRGETRGTIWESHFSNVIHLFWIGVVVFALFLAAIAFGAFGIMQATESGRFPGAIFLLPGLWLCGVAYFVWYIYRLVKGLIYAIDAKAYS